MPETFTCEACGGTFIGTSTEAELEAERRALAEVDGEELAVVCDDCFLAMREQFPTLDARLKLAGL